MKLYRAIARAVAFYHASENSGDYAEKAEALVKEHMPSGSGFDNGTKIDLERSNLKRLVFQTSFHHMNDVGMYDGWTDHIVVLTATLDGHSVWVSGRDKRQIKEYIENEFWNALNDIEVNEW